MFNDLFLSDNYFTNCNMLPCDDGDDSGDAAPDVQVPPPGQGDISALTGAPAQPAAPIAMPAPNVQGNPAGVDAGNPAGYTATNPAPAPAGQLNLQQPPAPPAAAPAAPIAAPVVPKAAGTPSVWKQLVMGALVGASQGAGGKGFGQGMARGSTAVSDMNQQKVENAQNAQKLQFESVQAANDAIRARNEARAADDAHEEHAQQLAENSLIYNQTMKALGIEPAITISGDSPKATQNQASGALNVLAQLNGGSIPRVATVSTPDSASDDGKTHTTHVFTSPDPNSNKTRELVDEVSRIKTGAPVPDTTWTSGNGAMLGKIPNPKGGQQQMGMDAMQFLQPQLPSKDTDENAATSAANHMQLDAYKQRIGDNPTPTQQNVLNALESKTETFDSAIKNKQAAESSLKGTNVDKAQVGSFTQKTLPSLIHIPANEKSALAIEASQARTDAEFRSIETRADASENSHAELQAKYAEINAGKAEKQGEAEQDKATADNEKVWSDPQHGYAPAMQQVNQTRASISAAQNGNGLLTNMLPTMTVLGINKSAGISRISPAEAEAAKLNPEITTRWNALVDAGLNGKMTPKMAQQANELLDVVNNAAHQKAVQSSQFVAKSRHISYSQMPAMDLQGNVTTLDKVSSPAGTRPIANKDGNIVGYLDAQGTRHNF